MAYPKKATRIIFMGTAGFAVPSLRKLLEAGYPVAGVVTAPDKPAGRGQKLQASPVKRQALLYDIPVLQPRNLKDPSFLDALRQLRPALQVVVAFRMLPERVWALPALGTVNLHASLLPRYRGAAPINWAIINGEKETGVTTFFIDEKIDTGAILLQESTPIGAEETAGELHDRLMEQGADVMLKTVEAIRADTCRPQPQPNTGKLQRAPKIQKSDCHIRWDQPAHEVYNFIRGLSPYPAAWSKLNGKVFRIFKARKKAGRPGVVPGTVRTDHKTHFEVAAKDGWLALQVVQQEGRRKMDIAAFLRGQQQQTWTIG